MPYRKHALFNGGIYHIYNKSIAGYKIFNSYYNYERMQKGMVYYLSENVTSKFSTFLRDKDNPSIVELINSVSSKGEKIVKLITYCIMPTHYHFILQQLKDDGIIKFMTSVQKSYSEFFNYKYNRKGTLWEGRFKNILIDTDEYFLHLTRYIHLNPSTDNLVNSPEEWKFSSYKEYIESVPQEEKICDFKEYWDMSPEAYKEFVNDRMDYQRTLWKIKHLILE